MKKAGFSANGLFTYWDKFVWFYEIHTFSGSEDLQQQVKIRYHILAFLNQKLTLKKKKTKTNRKPNNKQKSKPKPTKQKTNTNKKPTQNDNINKIHLLLSKLENHTE